MSCEVVLWDSGGPPCSPWRDAGGAGGGGGQEDTGGFRAAQGERACRSEHRCACVPKPKSCFLAVLRRFWLIQCRPTHAKVGGPEGGGAINLWRLAPKIEENPASGRVHIQPDPLTPLESWNLKKNICGGGRKVFLRAAEFGVNGLATQGKPISVGGVLHPSA